MNAYYHTLNMISWDENLSTSYQKFNYFIKKIENLYLTVTQPTKYGLSIMKQAKDVVDKYVQEEKVVAIAAAKPVVMGCVWGLYGATTKLESDIEHGISNWIYYVND